MPFGSVAAVYAWDRVGAAFQHILREGLLLPVVRYVDDFFWAEHRDFACTVRDMVIELSFLLGIPLDIGKTPSPSPSLDILGVHVSLPCDGDLGEEVMLLIPDAKKMEFWRLEVQAAVKSGVLAPHAAERLVGRLGFGVAAVWGGLAAYRLRVLRHHSFGDSSHVSEGLREDLQWWDLFLASPPTRARPLLPPRDIVLLFTDAEGDGGLGAVLMSGTSSWWSACTTPPELTRELKDRKTQIQAFELAAVGWASVLFRNFLAGKFVLLFVDNTGALSNLKKGSGLSRDHAALALFVTRHMFRAALDFAIQWVPSKCNPADAPSRGRKATFGTFLPSRVRWEPICRAISGPA
jgi:hypothetical protein